MSFSSNFEVKATLYFRVHDADLYGGPGTVGFAKQSFELIPGAKLEDLNDIMAVDCKSSMAAFPGPFPVSRWAMRWWALWNRWAAP